MKFLIGAILCLALAGNAHSVENLESLNNKLDVITTEIENLKLNSRTTANKFSFGSYGEFTYTNKRTEQQNGTFTSQSQPNVDAKRFILYIGYKFNENWSLTSEVEIEHVSEIFLEQAYLTNKLSDAVSFQVGVMLVPVGLVNLYHEPTAFHSVERPGTENKIIPSTWREMGIGFSGTISQFDYKLYLFNSLKADEFTSSGVRAGRKKAARAEARDLSIVGRLDYSLLSNLDLGVSYYLGKADGVLTEVKHNVWDFHAAFDMSGLSLRVLYTEAFIDNAAALKSETGENVAEKMRGYYVDLGYDVFHGKSDCQLIPFVMYEAYNTQDTMPTGSIATVAENVRNFTYGINYKPLANIVFKADYMKTTNQAKTGYDTWSLGAGWNF
ncbi:MAG: hypothetical protein HN576_13690 [Bacteriovoracaceae bacterium]|nr:hypothetical protein [Bacteriovoracaceae bacterium]